MVKPAKQKEQSAIRLDLRQMSTCKKKRKRDVKFCIKTLESEAD